MTAYLDNNIIVSLENGDFTFEEVMDLFPENKIRFFYSSAHIFEAEAFKGNAFMRKDEFLLQRFKSIRYLFKNNYLFVNPGENRITHIIEDPKEVYDTITLVPFGIEAMKGFMNIFSKEQKQEARDQIGIDIQKLNNYNSIEIIEHLSAKLSKWGTNMSFIEMIEAGIKLHPNGNTLGLHNRIAGVFELLDMLGYWKDKETETSNYARLWDADHSFFASYCDYFVCNDKRTRQKTDVVYNIYNINTKIISLKTSG